MKTPPPPPPPPGNTNRGSSEAPADGLARIQANLLANLESRSIDGSQDNFDQPDWGAAGQALIRLAKANYRDGIGETANDLPNAREISNAVSQQAGDEPSSAGLSDMFWVWGQFIDHDITLTGSSGTEFTPISVPTGDDQFDPDGTGAAFVPFSRTEYLEGSGQSTAREYGNGITAFLDASMVYGSDEATATALRGDGGKLLLTEDGLLVSTDTGVLAGDVRAAENVALTSMHTLFSREHNLWVDRFAKQDPNLTADQLYAAARSVVEAEVQAITFNEFLPLLLGETAVTTYEGYDPTVNPGISVEFATAAFRFGHSLLSDTIQRLDRNGDVISAGNLTLREAFFNPDLLADNGGIDPLLRGLADGIAQELDTHVVEDVRSFLFGEPGSGGLDLAALNIARGRDLGVSGFNDLREAVGLERAASFAEITSDVDLAARLEELYGNVDLVDAWIGGLAEDPSGEAIIGDTFATIILDQFLRLRDGDPFWSQGLELPKEQIDALWSTSLADVIERNTNIRTIQDDVMLAYDRVGGTSEADALTGGAGRDLLLGREGDDRLEGGDGDDQLEGQAGNDLLLGQAGDDILYGGGGNDRLNGGNGDDELHGGDGSDTFVFRGNFGSDMIYGFGTGGAAGNDHLRFEAAGATTVQDVLASLRTDGGNTVIELGGGSVTLVGFDPARLTADDIEVA